MVKALGAVLCFTAGAYCAHVEHVAGGGDSIAGVPAGAPAKQVKLVEPFAVDFDAAGNWYICEYQGQRITLVDSSGRTRVFAGTGSQGYSGDGGPAVAAAFRDPHGLVISRSGQMYVADTLNHAVRQINLSNGTIATVAGTGQKGFSGDGGPANRATFDGTFGLALDRSGSHLYIADLFNRRVRKLDLKTGILSTVAGNGQEGNPQDGAAAVNSPLADPRAVAVDSKGNLYILERRANALRVVDGKGRIRTLIAPGTAKPDLNGPKHLCVDRRDRVIIADAENHLIRLYDPENGSLAVLAGTGEKGAHIAESNPLATELNRPHGVAVDGSGALYISDSYNHRILRVTGY